MTKLKKIILVVVLLIVIGIGVIFLKGVKSFSIISTSESLFSPARDERWDILILGNRGDAAKSGGILTDSIMILSYKKETGEAALISIPRDLWVEIPNHGMQRINFAYPAGKQDNPPDGGLKLAREVVGKVSGLNIDFVVVVDVEALKEIVDTLGGIDIYEEKYFSGQFYNYYVTTYPGKNHLSGSEALAYAGSRRTDSDFARMRRQQKVILAIKDKVFSLGILARPDRIWSIFNSLEYHLKTDIPLSQIQELIQLASGLEIQNAEQVVFDTSNYLYSTHTTNGSYILLPKTGDFSEIQAKCQDIFEKTPSTENLQQEAGSQP